MSLAAVQAATRKIRARSTPGSSVENGRLYHQLPGDLGSIPHHRGGTEKRIAQIAATVDVRGKSVLDLGCGPGGLSLGLARAGAASVVGFDADPQAIAVAKAAAAHMGLEGKVRFQEGRVEALTWPLGAWDIVIWCSEFMWTETQMGAEKAYDLLHNISRAGEVLVFETAAADGEAGIPEMTQRDVTEELEQTVIHERVRWFQDPSGWEGKRRVHFCTQPQVEWSGDTSTVLRVDCRSVIKTYLPAFRWMAEREARALDRLGAFDAVGGMIPKLIRYEAGSTVQEWCGFQRRVTWKALDFAAPVLTQVLKAARIQHRDVRPVNLVSPWTGGEAVLIDFGWCLFDDETDTPVPAPSQLNDREDGQGKWGGPTHDDARAFREVEKWMAR